MCQVRSKLIQFEHGGAQGCKGEGIGPGACTEGGRVYVLYRNPHGQNDSETDMNENNTFPQLFGGR